MKNETEMFVKNAGENNVKIFIKTWIKEAMDNRQELTLERIDFLTKENQILKVKNDILREALKSLTEENYNGK